MLGGTVFLLTSKAAELPASKQANPGAARPVKTMITHADPAAAQILIDQKKAVVLDIRTPKEFAAGHIDGAKNIDFNAADFEKHVALLDKNRTYLVHCAGGGRSTKSLEVFKKLAFAAVVHLDGGFQAWEKAGKPVKK